MAINHVRALLQKWTWLRVLSWRFRSPNSRAIGEWLIGTSPHTAPMVTCPRLRSPKNSLSVHTVHAGAPCRSVERSLIHHSRVPINLAPGPQYWGMYNRSQQCHPLTPSKCVPACKDRPTWFPRRQTGRFKGSCEHLYRRQGSCLRSILIHIQKRRMSDANCVKAVG